jgi:hypothetical protein
MHMNLKEALTLLCVDDLKSLIRQLPDSTIAGRKAELVDGLVCRLLGPDLPALWRSLNTLHKAAVAEAVHDPLGELSLSQFQAKYGSSPGFGKGHSSALALFIYNTEFGRNPAVPADLNRLLMAFVPEPAPMQINTSLELADVPDQQVRLTDADALQDLAVMLRAIEQERITVGEKTGVASSAAQRLLSTKLAGGDFYPWTDKVEKYEQQVGPIKAFAWPLLMQAGGLATRTGSRLGLSPAGIKAQSARPAEVIRTLWRKWLKTTLLDEFSRIDAIKGQNSAGRVMGGVAARRDAIQQALQDCPLDCWIAVDELSRFMQASGLDFVVAHDPWKLFIGDKQYGSLGYANSHGWEILQHRYILALLFEYAATLGLIDVAYVDPATSNEGKGAFRGLWGAEDLSFLSRYDGLSHFRINALGAYVLDLTDSYQPKAAISAMTLRVMQSLSVGVQSGVPDAQAQLMLDTWAERLPDGLWRLDHSRALSAVEKGHDASELVKFLQNHTNTPLPETVAAFIVRVQSDANAVKLGAAAVLMHCRDAATAQHISEHKTMHRLCLRVEPATLMVRVAQQEKFREALRQLGLGLGS